VRRGDFVECVHEVHAVAVGEDGALVASAGDPALVASLRSSAKPFQALPLARAYPELAQDELAIAAASHYGTERHVAAVRKLLAATGGREEELDCGLQDGRPREPIYDNCSGKHAGMLATCRAHGWPVEGYRRREHPLQQLLLEEVAAAAQERPDEIGTGIDGCGVVAFALPLERVGLAFSRLEQLDGGDRVAEAMRAHPELVGGKGATDTTVMEDHPGVLAKGGAEGLLCASGGGMGFALKVRDGNPRALRPALAAFAARLEIPIRGFEEVPVQNRHGDLAAIVSIL
jgi:L-asparaginase II